NSAAIWKHNFADISGPHGDACARSDSAAGALFRGRGNLASRFRTESGRAEGFLDRISRGRTSDADIKPGNSLSDEAAVCGKQAGGRNFLRRGKRVQPFEQDHLSL